MKRVLDRQYEEQGMLDASSDDEDKKRKPRRPRPKTREVLDIREWATGKIEDTPHGFFAKMMDATLYASITPHFPAVQVSNFH